MTSYMPGLFPTRQLGPEINDGDSHYSTSNSNGNAILNGKDLALNSLHTKKKRIQKFQKECLKDIELVMIIELIVSYLIDNSIMLLALRYGLQYLILNLNKKLDDIMLVNEEIMADGQEEISARESLTELISTIKSRFRFFVTCLIFLVNLICIVSHLLFLHVEPTTDLSQKYSYGFCFINVIGELIPTGKAPIVVLDVFILVGHFVMYHLKFNETMVTIGEERANASEVLGHDEDYDYDDGYDGEVVIFGIDLMPRLNSNYLVEYFKLSPNGEGVRLGAGTRNYGSV